MGLLDWLKNCLSPKSLADERALFPLELLRKRVKILVIDDDKASFPIDLMNSDGYSITQWEALDVNRLRQLETGDFDIVFLDIQGVAPSTLVENDGIGVLERIKKVNPTQIVVAFSSHSFDLSKNKFWRIADDTLSKPVSFLKCKETVDRLISEKICIGHYWSIVLGILTKEGISKEKISQIEKIVAEAQTTGKIERTKIQNILEGCSAIDAVIGVAGKILDLWKSIN